MDVLTLTDLRDIRARESIITPRFDIAPAFQLDLYHAAMLKWLEDVTRDETIQNPDMRFDLSGMAIPDEVPSQLIEQLSHTLPVVFATPDRAFAQVFILIDHIRQSLGLSPVPQDITRRFLALPMVSFGLNSVTAKREWFVLGMKTFKVFTEDGLVYLYPVPHTIDYTVSIWTRTKQVLYRLYERVLLQFRHNVMYFKVDYRPFHPELKDLLVSIELTSSAERSELEPGVGRDRVLRLDMSFVVTGYLFLQGFLGKLALNAKPQVEARNLILGS